MLDYYHAIKTVERIYEGERIFDYNAMGKRILEVIKELPGSPDPVFQWLSDDDKSKAKQHFISIDSVPGPLPMF